MVDVNTVVGDAVETKDGSVIVPVSQVAFGFCAGGGEYGSRPGDGATGLPFGGGSGAGVSVRPVAFLVVCQGAVRLLPVDQRASFERLLELAPEVLERVLGVLGPRSGGSGPSAPAASAGDGVAAPPAGMPAVNPA
jgi:sporulation protein YtfJ